MSSSDTSSLFRDKEKEILLPSEGRNEAVSALGIIQGKVIQLFNSLESNGSTEAADNTQKRLHC